VLSTAFRDGKFSFARLGHRKNQILFLFLPVKKYGFCSRGTVFLIAQWKNRGSLPVEFYGNHCPKLAGLK